MIGYEFEMSNNQLQAATVQLQQNKNDANTKNLTS